MKRFIASIITLFMATGFSACKEADVKNEKPTDSVIEQEVKTEKPIVDADSENDIEKLLAGMTVDEKIYQMMFVTPESITGVGTVTQAGEGTKAALENYPVGGIIYFKANIKDPEQITHMIKNSQEYSHIPLFIGVDEEGGRVARLSGNEKMGLEKIGAMANVKTKEEAYSIGTALGSNLKKFGFNVDFAPVADVIVDINNTEIGDRSFGTDPNHVAQMVGEVVSGIEKEKVSSVLKHFPGHGSTVVDSHTGYSASYRTLEELKACEFVPFKKGIEKGCDFVMVSHMTLENATKEKCASSLSKEVIEGMLKGELGFDGIVITDSLSMGAITKEYTQGEACVKAIEAGCDMLLMPQNVQEAKSAIKNALETGRLSQERIDESVRKILTIKKEKGIL